MLARFQLRKAASSWPILPEAGVPPKGWPGWPSGKQFALVLTHDVEGPRGLANCEAVMQLEMDLGLRSSFNFVPEGSYQVPGSLINRLVENGFEVGVHDLHHNGKLYRNKKCFDAAAPRVNHYLREWNAVGFRSGFMHRNLDWLHALDIEYDMSTFDTDPFEPQPDGANTIFPFWVPAPGNSTLNSPLTTCAQSAQDLNRTGVNSRCGYTELPYTLPQDSTLFLVLGEKDSATWQRKLDWIVECGGMALVNVHPDYICFTGKLKHQYPADIYKEFMQYVLGKYDGDVCCMLPRDAASLVKAHATRHPDFPAAAR